MPASPERRRGEQAIVELYSQWFHQVARWLRAMGTPDADLDDLSQEVFIVARRHVRSFDGNNPGGWLYRIAENQARNHRRKAWFRHVFLGTREDAQEPISADGAPAEILEQKQRRAVARALMGRIHESRRATFFLYEIEGMSGEEIAQLQNVPVNTVWTRLHLARKEFTRLVAEYRQEQATQEGEA